ncbi:DNA polymerase III subunit delta' C-terminal domain-containing protein [Vibrio methylphosphonaticus]|uniref:DNA polymerase III subunit delta' C-terminal domain-containing protein n=1 Tax=Vibrio methylphosphonaticus TaxID=2946866 RepID=UPI002029F48B|nr:DNA polymerase III subunit delta' C-terminal domain-containing protein [Vibrio methylphosphonaticus]MCL9774313.1 DNA polymerase III subunit delta' [Vibrio methylphosphonaticus]
MKSYPWLEGLWLQLKQSLDNDRIPGALLIQAQKGLAPDALIHQYVSGVMCQNDPSEPCGFCHSCDLLKSESHPDVHYLLPEKDKKALSVDQIRQANKWAQESSQFGRYRIIVIPNAETMNVSASNALLKTLEEPAKQCLFILSTENAKLLLPTIRSRCEVWHIALPNAQTCLEWVGEQTGKPVSESAGYLCSYEPLTVLNFIKEKHDKSYDLMMDAFITFLQGTRLDTSSVWAEMSKSKIDLSITLGWYWHLLCSAQKWSLGLSGENYLKEAGPLAELFSYECLFQQGNRIQELRSQLRSNPGLNGEVLFASWLYEFG